MMSNNEKGIFWVFNSTLWKVQDNLYQKSFTVYEKLKTEEQKKLNTKTHFNKIKTIEKKIIDLNKQERDIDLAYQELRGKQRLCKEQISVINQEIQNLDPRTQENEEFRAEYMKLDFNWFEFAPGFYSLRSTEYKALMKFSKTKEYRNSINWNKIRQKYNDMRTLAISSKQRQQIIIDLQNKIDRHWLDIEIPVLFEVQKVEIRNGEIIISNALPSPE